MLAQEVGFFAREIAKPIIDWVTENIAEVDGIKDIYLKSENAHDMLLHFQKLAEENEDIKEIEESLTKMLKRFNFKKYHLIVRGW